MVGERLGITVGLSALLAGCAGLDRERDGRRPASIGHIVFVKLKDPTHRDVLIADSDRMLRPIPGVAAYSAGPHLDTGRASVIADYDVAMYIGFDSAEDYARYVSHPNHVGLVERWKPDMEWLRVYDFEDLSE